MDHLHWDLGVIEPEDVVEVTLDRPANVQLLDPTNYEHYRNKRPYEYYGGYVSVSPYRIHPAQRGHWHLAVDLGGSAGAVKAAVSVLSQPAGEVA